MSSAALIVKSAYPGASDEEINGAEWPALKKIAFCFSKWIWPLALMSPSTCNFFVGVFLPIPTFPVSLSTTN